MYEAWFLAAAASLAGKRNLNSSLIPPDHPEDVANAKTCLTDRMAEGRSYSETLDQPALTASLDLHAACNSPSFRKLCRDLHSLLWAARSAKGNRIAGATAAKIHLIQRSAMSPTVEARWIRATR